MASVIADSFWIGHVAFAWTHAMFLWHTKTNVLGERPLVKCCFLLMQKTVSADTTQTETVLRAIANGYYVINFFWDKFSSIGTLGDLCFNVQVSGRTKGFCSRCAFLRDPAVLFNKFHKVMQKPISLLIFCMCTCRSCSKFSVKQPWYYR